MQLLYKLRSKLMRFCNLRLGMRLTRSTPDRLWLHNWLLDNAQGARVLSVGVSWYTMLLPELTDGHWVTVDNSESQAAYGCTSQKHYTADFASRYTGLPCDLLSQERFDLVLLNGVVGVWGMQTPLMANLAIANAELFLRVGGLLLIGYNATDDKCGFDIKTLPALAGFRLLSETLADSSPKSMHTFLLYRSV